MANYLPLPDGTYYPVAEGEDPKVAWQRAMQKYPEAFADKAPEEAPKSGFVPALKAGFSSLKGDVAALAGRTGIMGLPEAEKYIAEQEAYQKKTFAPTQEGWLESPLTKVGELAGGSLPYMAAPLLAGAAAPAAAALGAGTGLATAAGIGASALASAGQFTGSNLSRQMTPGEGMAKKSLGETDLTDAALASLPQAALDTVSMRMIPGLGKMFERAGIDLSAKAARDLAKEGIRKTAADYLLATGKTMGVEGLTEAGQQVFERMQAGLDISNPAARAEYFDNFIGGAVLGGILAPAGRYVERGREQTRFDVGARAEAAQTAQQNAAQEAERAAQTAAQEEERKQSPEYAAEIEQQYADLQSNFANLKAQAAVKVEPTDLAGMANSADAKKALKAFMSDEGTRTTVQEYNRIQKLKPQPEAPAAPTTEAPVVTTVPAAPTAETPAAPTAETPAAIPLEDTLAQLDAHIEAVAVQGLSQNASPAQIIGAGAKQKELQNLRTKINRVTGAMNKARELGNMVLAGKHAKTLQDLQAQVSALGTPATAGTEGTEGTEGTAGIDGAGETVVSAEAAPEATGAAPPPVRKPTKPKPLKPYTGITEQGLMFPETGVAESVINAGQGKQPEKSRLELMEQFRAAKQVRDRLGMQNAIEQMRVLDDRSKARSAEARGVGAPKGEVTSAELARDILGQKLTATGSQAPSRELTNAAKVNTTPDILRKQIANLPDRLSPESEQLVGRLLGNFDAFTADPERTQLAAGFLHDLRTGVSTARARARDVASELDTIEAADRPDQAGLFDGKWEKNAAGAWQKPAEALPIIQGPRKPLPVPGYSEAIVGPPKPAPKPAPEKTTSLVDRENADAAKRKAENERAARLAAIPGESVSFEAHRQALETLDDVGPRLDDLVAKAADETLPEPTRNKAKREIKKLSLARKFLESTSEGNGELRLQAEEELAKLKVKIDKQEKAVGEDPTKSRKQELAKSRRRKKELDALVKGFASRAERVAIKTPTDKTRQAAEDRAERFTQLSEALNIEGTTGALPARKVGPVVRKAQAAANIRTGVDGEEGVETRRIGPGTKPEQGGATKAPTPEKAIEDANKMAEEKIANRTELTDADLKMLDLRQHFALFEAAQNMRRGLERQQTELTEKMARAANSANPSQRNMELRAERELELQGIERDLSVAYENEKKLSEPLNETTAAFEEAEESLPTAPKTRRQQVAEENPVPEKTPAVVAPSVKKTAKENPKLSEQDIADGVESRSRWIDKKYNTEMDTESPYHGKTYAEAARIAAEKARNPLSKKLFSILADTFDTAYASDMHGRVYVLSKAGFETLEDGSRKRVTGHYNPGHNYVLVPNNKVRSDATKVLLHELLHAATSRGLFTNKAFNARVEQLRNTVEKWLQTPEGKAYYRDNKMALVGFKKNGIYGLTNTHEFLAEAFSDKAFQDLLDQIPSETPKKSVLSRLIDAFAGFFRFAKPEERSLLNDVLEITDEAMVETAPLNADAKWRKPPDAEEVLNAPPKYESNDALSDLAQSAVAQPKTFKEKLGSNAALRFEMQVADMRAGVIKALNNAVADPKTMGSTKLFRQAVFSITAADQHGAVTQMALSNGPPKMVKDSKGYYEVQSTMKNDAGAVFDAVQDIPDTYGNTEAKMGLASVYMIAQRAMNKGLKKLDLGALGITEEKIAAAMAAVNADPALKTALESVRSKYNAYNRGMIEWLSSPQVAAITQADAAAYLKDEDYVPYYRVRPDGTAELVFGGEKTITIGDIRHQPYLAELKGGESKIMPLDQSIMRNTMLLVTKGMNNMAMKNVGYAMQAAGQGLGPVDKTGKPTSLMPVHSGKGPDDTSVLRWTQEPDPSKPTDTGDRWLRVQTNDTIFGGIPAEIITKSLDGAHLTLPAFLKWGGIAGDLLRSGVTRTPIYLARQLFRDPFAATATSGLDYNPITAIFKANKEFLKITAGKSEAGAKMIEKGLLQSGMFEGDPANMSKIALQLASGKSQGILNSFFARADRWALQADAATRALIYENAIKNGLSEVEASHAVRESMNFSKRGLSPTVQYASRMIPFFNAQIQGLSVLFKAATGNMPANDVLKIKRKFFNNAMMLTGVGIAYAMAMDDDDYYKNAKPKDRYSNFFMHLPGVDEPIKLPIPYEFGFFFSAGVALSDAIKGEVDTPQQLRAIKDMFVGAIPGASGNFVPQIIKPMAEVYANKNFYSGNALESGRLQKLDPEARYNAHTTEVAKWMATMVPGLSPIQIEHIVSGYLGQIPLMVLASTNEVFRDGKTEPTRKLSEMPLIGSSFQRKYGGEEADVVYKLATDASQAKRTFDEFRKTGKAEEAKDYLQTHRAEIAVAPMAMQYQKVMGALRTQEEIIRNSKASSDAKAKRIDELDAQRQLQSERYLKAIRRAEEASGKTTPP